METKLVKVPFEVEMAKKITEKSVDGKIITRDGRNVRIVCWDVKDKFRPILALIMDSEEEKEYTYFTDGMYYGKRENEKDLMLEIPEYMNFKDGDVITYDKSGDIAITMAENIKEHSLTTSHYYVRLDRGVLFFYNESVSTILNSTRLSTEEEKQKLIDALKASKEPKAKEYLKRFFGIEQKQEYEFKLFDRVLVRDDEEDDWKIAEYSHKTEFNQYYVVGGLYWLRCIPYNEKTSHLLGTTEDYKED